MTGTYCNNVMAFTIASVTFVHYTRVFNVMKYVLSVSYDCRDVYGVIDIFHCRRRFDFQSPSRIDRNIELFLNIEKTLKEVVKTLLSCYNLVMVSKSKIYPKTNINVYSHSLKNNNFAMP